VRAPSSVVAVDWSGDAHLARRRIFLAEARESGRLVRLEDGRNRAEMTAHLLALPPETVIGLDFGFSFPAPFLDALGVHTAPEVWAMAAACGEHWIAECRPPFWGRPGRPRQSGGAIPPFRRTELAVPRVAGIGPKSMFQIGGAGAVGTGSLRGMPLLHALHGAGARIWPYTSRGRGPTVVEIYPRLLTGPVHKSNAAARQGLLNTRYPIVSPTHRDLATRSEDAFDAAVSALVMLEHLADLQSLPAETDPNLQREGRIWHPAWREDRLDIIETSEQ
jgi:hypothetical protein